MINNIKRNSRNIDQIEVHDEIQIAVDTIIISEDKHRKVSLINKKLS